MFKFSKSALPAILKNGRFLLIAGLMIGFVFGYFLKTKSYSEYADVKPLRLNSTDYHFIRPLLIGDFSENKEFLEFKPLEKKIKDLADSFKINGRVEDLGFYFRALDSGRWVTLNEDDKFYPASLMKVPLMIAYFKEAESNPSVLDQKLTYSQKDDLNKLQDSKPSQSIKEGQSYAVYELIQYMIDYSDNNATRLLSENIDQNFFHEVYTDLSMQVPDSRQIGDSDYLTIKQYSLFFRILYNATYLNKDFSDKVLKVLAETDFKDGLVSGLPGNLTIAHKFGEFINLDSPNPFELHDCGIIYYPNNPYLLCVMTKGKNRSDLKEAIKQVSSLVYNEISNNYQ